MTEKEAVLELKELSIDFQTVEGTVHAVNRLSYRLHRGEKLAIVGESGSGKSVSSLAVMGLLPQPPTKIRGGEILFEGRDLLKLTEEEMQEVRGNQISMIFQEPMTSLNPIIPCGKQIAEVLILHKKMNKKEAMAKAIDLMRDVGIADPEKRAYEYPHQMSGGMRQRVMIAIALACSPKILIADEPTTALDVTIQAQILDLIKKLNREVGASILFITHDLGVVRELCDSVLVMYTGNIVEKAPIDVLFESPRHPYSRGLLDAIPRMAEEREPLKTIEGQVPAPTEPRTGCSFAGRCSRRMDKCRNQEPPVIELAEDHQVSCWLYEEEGHE